MINCRELYRNPLELKSQPSWMLRSKGLKHNKSVDIQQREFLWNICRRLLPLKGACKFSRILSWTSCLADYLELSKLTGPFYPRLSKLFIFLKIVSHKIVMPLKFSMLRKEKYLWVSVSFCLYMTLSSFYTLLLCLSLPFAHNRGL